MTKGITEKEPDPRIVYADIIDLPHHQSSKQGFHNLGIRITCNRISHLSFPP